MYYQRTPNSKNVIISRVSIAVFTSLSLVTMLACGPMSAADVGDSFGDDATGEPGESGGDVDPPDVMAPEGPVFCVEESPSSVTCWVGWGVAFARVLLPCQVEQFVGQGTRGPGYDEVLDYWGPVVCHDVLGGGKICLYSTANVLLEQELGVWLPYVSALVGGYPEVEPPCLDGCSGENCACETGGCDEGLVCVLYETCQVCSPGEVGCPCGEGGLCEIGACYTGQDSDGTGWNICYPADLLSCVLEPCPGDAYCTDSGGCAWPG